MSVNLTPQKSAIPRQCVGKTDAFKGKGLAAMEKTEREAIVAWLRRSERVNMRSAQGMAGRGTLCRFVAQTEDFARTLAVVAEAIERGDHLIGLENDDGMATD